MRPQKPKTQPANAPRFDDGDPHLAPVNVSPLSVARSWAPFGRLVPKLVKPPKTKAARR